MKNIFLLALFPFYSAIAQNVEVKPTTENEIEQSWEKRAELAQASLLKNYPARNVGPVVQGGRITDLEVISPTHYLIAFASGGLWETKDHGITFNPVFDEKGALGIGDFAISTSDPSIIYVGTGENNSSRSSYAGDGVYKSTDAGKSWEHIGLTNTQHIGKVIIHPQDPDVVWIASMGALYSHNEERGVYKSTDGGNTWDKTLFINDSTGIIDLIINPENPNQLWAAAWERTRKAHHFKGNGPGSGIYRSDDGGETWQKKMNGFPEGNFVGRIGLDIAHSEPNIMYAFLDNQEPVEKGEEISEAQEGLKLGDFRDMTAQHLLNNINNELLNKFLKEQGFPKKYTAERIKANVREGKYTPREIADYFGDANAALFNAEVEGAQLFRSENGGDNWQKVNSYDLEGVYFTYGYYFGEVRVDPNDPDKVYILGVPLLKTADGGKTYARIDTIGDVHVDHQAFWIDPENSKHILLGNDGGLYESYDEGANWLHINNIPAGQFYTVNYDMQQPYHIYGGLQDNGTLAGSSKSVPNRSKHWERIFGGDGMFVAPDPGNPDLVYAGFQFGNYYRIDRSKGKINKITPQHEIGEDQLRFNWRTPLIMSSHNPDILYIGAQKVFRTLNQGEDWTSLSGDLTQDYPQGNVPFSTISSLAESPLKFGMLYVGTDDGHVHRSDAAGGEWVEITNGLPEDLWVSSIHPSSHDENIVYVSLNGYRFDNFNTYVYKSTDKGETWSSLKGNLPEVVINVITEDPVNKNLLYLGTDHGTYVSFDGGNVWELFNNALNVASYDIKVHPRENEVIVGTHGRSIFVADVKPWQQLTGDNLSKAILAYEPSAIRHSDRWGESRYPYTDAFKPAVDIQYFTAGAGKVEVEVYNPNNELIHKETINADRGFNRYAWNLKGGVYKKKKQEPSNYISPGKYRVTLNKDGESSSVTVEVKE
ncbi:MAG: WD40/YVTN/BNR-like repeat-containing protein [Candidatus Cyclobacteriaceae bacterium M2_1C_046]